MTVVGLGPPSNRVYPVEGLCTLAQIIVFPSWPVYIRRRQMGAPAPGISGE
jgi:hypothetical protein